MARGYPVLRAQENLARTLRGIGDIGETKYKAGLLDLETAKTQHALQLGQLQKESLQRKADLEKIAVARAKEQEQMLNQPADLRGVVGMLSHRNAGPLDMAHLANNVLPEISKATGWGFQEGRLVNKEGTPVTYRDIRDHSELIQGTIAASTDLDEWAEDTIAQYKNNPEYQGDETWEARYNKAKQIHAQMKKDPTAVWDRQEDAMVKLRGVFRDRGWSTEAIDSKRALLQKKKDAYLGFDREKELIRLRAEEKRKTAREARKLGGGKYSIGETREIKKDGKIVTEEFTKEGWVTKATAPRWEPTKEKPEMTPSEALKEIALIQEKRAKLEKADTVTTALAALVPELADMVGQDIPEELKKQAFDAWDRHIEYLERFTPKDSGTKTFIYDREKGFVPK